MKGTAETYLIRNGQEWARVFILEGERATGERWGYLSILSDFGQFGNYWNNVGGRSFRAFLASLEFTYAMEKLRPREHRMQFDLDASLANAKRHVFRARRERSITDTCARRLYAEIREIASEGTMGCERYGHLLMDALGEYWDRWNAWEWCCSECYSPECTGFWQNLWPKLLTEFRAEGALA